MGRNNSYHKHLSNPYYGETVTKPIERDLEEARNISEHIYRQANTVNAKPTNKVTGSFMESVIAQALADQRERDAKIADVIPNGDNCENYIAQAIRTGGKS